MFERVSYDNERERSNGKKEWEIVLFEELKAMKRGRNFIKRDGEREIA